MLGKKLAIILLLLFIKTNGAEENCPHRTFLRKHVCSLCTTAQDIEKFALRVRPHEQIFKTKYRVIFQRSQKWVSDVSHTFFNRSMRYAWQNGLCLTQTALPTYKCTNLLKTRYDIALKGLQR